jgi:hypothetical protein
MFLYASFLSIVCIWSTLQAACPVVLITPLRALAYLQPVGLVFDASNQAINIHSLACWPAVLLQ